MKYNTRRRIMIAGCLIFIVSLITATVLVASDAAGRGVIVVPPASSLTDVTRVPPTPTDLAVASQVPVLVYHEMNNDCPPAGATCPSHDYETVSAAQFAAELGWMHNQGYHTITLPQYLTWLKDKNTRLPSKPFLITVDNGISDFLQDAQPILYRYRDTATAFIVTGFADAASGKCGPRISGVDVQPGCPASSQDGDWDATWTQLRALNPEVYSFGIEAGADGHYQQGYNPACYAFNACKLPGETNTVYESRVRSEYTRGIAEAAAELGGRFDKNAWVVPYSDLGYTCDGSCSSFEGYDGPAGWLVSYAATTYNAVFVQDPARNGVRGERFRYEIHNTTTLSQFTTAVRYYLTHGSWDWR